MNLRTYLSKYSRLEITTMLFASLLSLSCLARGAVYDVTIAVLLFASMPLLYQFIRSDAAVHKGFQRTGILLLAVLAVVLFLQFWLPPSAGDADLWKQVTAITKHDTRNILLHDKTAWLEGVGRILFFTFSFAIALYIGASESLARLFLQALLVSGAVCLTLTFFVTTANGVPVSSYYAYSHGFVNSNNAASYLGIMLLLTLAQAARFLWRPKIALSKILPDFIDQLNLGTIIQGFALLYAMLLTLAGLFMTGSRGGIFFSLLCSFLFVLMIILKANLSSLIRRWIILSTSCAMALILIWSFINFGQTVATNLERDGLSHHTRLEIYGAVFPMIADHPLLGVGLGGFPAAFQKYRPDNVPADGIIDKAHNSYLEFASEMGLPALCVLLFALSRLGYSLYRGVKERHERYITPALGFSVWALVGMHSLIDFPLQIPSICALCIALTTVCASQTDPRFSEPTLNPENARVRRVRIRKRRSRNSGNGAAKTS